MKGKKKIIIIAIVAVMAVCIIFSMLNRPEVVDTVGGDKTAPRVQVERVRKDNIVTKIASSGKLEAIESKTVYLKSNGTIDAISKKVGDIVKKGDVILTLDKEAKLEKERQIKEYELKVTAAEEELSSLIGQGSTKQILNSQATLAQNGVSIAQAKESQRQAEIKLGNLEEDLAKAQDELKVQEDLYAEGLISEEEKKNAEDSLKTIQQSMQDTKNNISQYNQSIAAYSALADSTQYELNVLLNKVEDASKQSQVANARSILQSSQNLLASAQADLENLPTEVLAPIDGVITKVPENEGATVTAGTELVTVVNPDKLRVTCEVSPYYAADLINGLAAEIKYTGSKTIEVSGSVSSVAAMATVKTTSNGEKTFIEADVDVDATEGILKPGFSVDVKIITQARENVCVVPLLATMQDDEENSYLYVVQEDGTLEKRDIVEGLSDNMFIEVSGVEEGEMVVSSPADYLADIAKVSYEKLGDVE